MGEGEVGSACSRVLLGGVTVLVFATQTGCSFAGLAIGASIPRRSVVAPETLAPKDDVTLIVRGGAQVEGAYVGVVGDRALLVDHATVRPSSTPTIWVRKEIVEGPPGTRKMIVRADAHAIGRVDEDTRRFVVPTSLVEGTVRTDGTYALPLFLVGLAFDVTALILLSQFHPGAPD